MSPLTVGAAVAAVLAGPSLYTLVQTGGLDGTSALARGLVVAAVCTVGAAYVQDIIAGYEAEIERKHVQHVQDLAEAERLVQVLAQAKAEAQAQAQQPQPPPGVKR